MSKQIGCRLVHELSATIGGTNLEAPDKVATLQIHATRLARGKITISISGGEHGVFDAAEVLATLQAIDLVLNRKRNELPPVS